jgi:hypothetical protein
VKTGGMAVDEHLVKVSEMEEWAQLAFEGYKCALPHHQVVLRAVESSFQSVAVISTSADVVNRPVGMHVAC